MSLNDYKHTLTIPTRWYDNDVYGHVNNVVYYSYFDTVVNELAIIADNDEVSGDGQPSELGPFDTKAAE